MSLRQYAINRALPSIMPPHRKRVGSPSAAPTWFLDRLRVKASRHRLPDISVGIGTIRQLESAGITSLGQVVPMSVEQLVATGIQKRFAKQIVAIGQLAGNSYRARLAVRTLFRRACQHSALGRYQSKDARSASLKAFMMCGARPRREPRDSDPRAVPQYHPQTAQ